VYAGAAAEDIDIIDMLIEDMLIEAAGAEAPLSIRDRDESIRQNLVGTQNVPGVSTAVLCHGASFGYACINDGSADERSEHDHFVL
jgi:hypothetical protein